MNNGVQVWVKCDACHHGQFTSSTECGSCGQNFSESALNKSVLPKDTPKENPIKKEISCYQCRSLWIGIGISGIAFTILLNFFYNIFNFEIYVTYDIIRYVSSFVVIGFLSWVAYHLMKYYCKGGYLGGDGGDKIDKGNKSALAVSLTICVGVLLLLVVTMVSLETSAYFYDNYELMDSFNEFSDSETRQLIQTEFVKESNQCRFVKQLIDRSQDSMFVDYHNINIGYVGMMYENEQLTEIGAKYKGCWND